MSTTILTEVQIQCIGLEMPSMPLKGSLVEFARAIEQAVLQSTEVQAWKRDAEIYRALVANCHTCSSNFEKSGVNEGKIKSMTISIRVGENTNPGMQESLRSLLEEFRERCAAMEKQP